jgi:hypothetical protein
VIFSRGDVPEHVFLLEAIGRVENCGVRLVMIKLAFATTAILKIIHITLMRIDFFNYIIIPIFLKKISGILYHSFRMTSKTLNETPAT